MHNIKLSNLSKKPPWPDKKLLEFFKLFVLLKKDSIKSPHKLETIIKDIKITSNIDIKDWNIITYIDDNKIEKNIPPISPSSVLLGLINLNSLCLPKIFPEIYENISNEIIVIINKLNFK